MQEEETRNEIPIGRDTYDLRHLAPKMHRSTVMLMAEPLQVKSLPVEVAYTMHCWTRGLRAGETEDNVPATHLFYDGKVPRLFCQRRYDLSKQLPALIENMLAEHPVVYAVKGGNFVHFEMVEELDDGTQIKITYYMILHLRKSTPDKGRFIKLRVETAYPEDLVNYGPTHYDPKGFNLEKLLRETWMQREGAPKPGKPKKKKK